VLALGGTRNLRAASRYILVSTFSVLSLRRFKLKVEFAVLEMAVGRLSLKRRLARATSQIRLSSTGIPIDFTLVEHCLCDRSIIKILIF